MKIYSILLIVVIATSWPSNAEDFATEIPFQIDFNIIWLTVSAFNDQHTFMFDTGASCHVLDWSLIPENFPSDRIKLQHRAGVGIVGRLIEPEPLHLRGISVQGTKSILMINMDQVRSASGVQVRGALGVSLLKDTTLTIDFDRQILTLGRASSQSGAECQLPIVFDKFDRPYVKSVTVGGYVVSALVDTGSNGAITLDRTVFDRLVEDGSITNLRSTIVTTVSGINSRRKGNLSTLDIGDFHFRDVPVSESKLNLIGVRLLRKFRITFAGDKLIVSPSESFNEKYLENRSGAALFAKDGMIVVYRVRDNSPAQDCGLIEEDRIVRVDDVEVSAKDLNYIRRLLSSRDGERDPLVLLEVERNETELRTVRLDCSQEQ